MSPQGFRQRDHGQADISIDTQTRLPRPIRPTQILRTYIDLDEFHTPIELRRHPKRQDPVQPGAEQEDDIGVPEGGAAGRGNVQWG